MSTISGEDDTFYRRYKTQGIKERMKKVPDIKKNNTITLAKRRHELNLRRKGVHYDKNKKSIVQESVFGIPIITAPPLLCIYIDDGDLNKYEVTLNFVKRLHSLKDGTKHYISFRNTHRIGAAALLLIYSALEDCIKERGCSISYIPPDSPDVRRQLKSLYIPKLLANSGIDYSLSDSEHLPIISGSSNKYIDEVVDHIKERIYDDELDDEKESIFGSAVTETVDNVDLHAYPSLDTRIKKWWLVCSVINNQLFLAIYDKGVGIPTTIRGKRDILNRLKNSLPILSRFKERLSSEMSDEEATELLRKPGGLSDAESIFLSMMSNVSSTHEDKHGQGSKSIKALVDENERGKLWIFSSEGLYVKESQGGGNVIELPSSMNGTLVQWNINLL
jgi:hypothetical protein